MTKLPPVEFDTPSCFGSEAVFNERAATCQACAFIEACAYKIVISELSSEQPDDADERASTPSDPASALPSGATHDTPPVDLAVTSPVNGGARPASPLSYAFPIPDRRQYERFSNAELVDELTSLIAQGGVSSIVSRYSTVRPEMCAVHIEMNLRQQHAPRFRPHPPLPKTAGAGDEADLARDRQVIDLHWRAHSLEKPLAQVDGYAGIFDCSTFDFETASRFAQLDWKSQTKVVHLHLSDDMQWEHALLQLPNIRDKWRTIENGDVRGDNVRQVGAPHIERLLRQSMSNMPHLKDHIPGLVLTWKAQRIVGDSPTRIAKLVALMTGNKPRDASAVRRTLTSLDGHLKNAPKMPKRPGR